MGRTRLFQQAGSPLIQGLSRTRRPFWQDWLAGVACAAAVVAVWDAGSAILDGHVSLETLGDALLAAGIGAQIAVPLSAFGVWFARRMGWGRPWLAGAVLASAGGVAFLEFWRFLPF